MNTHQKNKNHASGENAGTNRYVVLSPDGCPIALEPFASLEAAEAYIPRWCELYREQGFYSSVDCGRIPLHVLPRCLEIITLPPDDETPAS